MGSTTSSTSANRSKKIVVIGAGSFGIWSANQLSRMGYSVQLVTKSDYHLFLPATVRVAIANETDRTVIPLSQIVDDAVEIIKDDVTLMTEETVVLKERKLPYDALIVATGSKWSSPFGTTYDFGNNFKEFYAKEHEKIENAKHIMLIGGGFNNSELAGELEYKYKAQLKDGSKKVTIVHSQDLLLSGNGQYHEKLRRNVTNYFKNETNIELVLNAKAKLSENDPRHVTIGDKIIEADLIYQSTGFSASVPPHNFDNFTDENGFIKVDETWRCTGVSEGNVFAIGDVANIPYKGFVLHEAWIRTIAYNVDKVVKIPEVSKDQLKVSKPPNYHIPCVVSLGPERGCGQIGLAFLPWTIIPPQWLCVTIKSRDLLRNKAIEFWTSKI